MAITENSFSPEELQAAFEANPDLINLAIPVFKTKGLNVLTPEDHTNFIETERQRIATAEQEKFNKELSTRYNQLDTDIETTFGIKKLPNEKSYETVKRVGAEWKQKIEDLEAKIAAGATDPTLKAKLDDYLKKEEAWTQKEQTYEKQLFEKDVNYEISKGLSGFKAKPGIPEVALKATLREVTAEIIGAAQRNDKGELIYVGADGNTILNDKAQPADATWILNDRLKEVADTGHNQPGAGTQGGKAGAAGGGETKVLPDGIPSKVAVSEALKKMGVLDGDPEHTRMYDEYLKKYPNLPFKN